MRNELKAGIFLLFGVLVFAASVFIMGREKQLFSKSIDLATVFQDVKGLKVGAPVKLGGIAVGRVSKIFFSYLDSTPKQSNSTSASQNKTIKVIFSLLDKYRPMIPTDSTTTLETVGLLGDMFLTIKPGESDEIITSGSMLQSFTPLSLADSASDVQGVLEKVKDITANLESISKKLNSSGIQSLNNTLSQIEQTSKEINEGDGIVAKLLRSPELANKLERSINSIENVTSALESGEGILPYLLTDTTGKAEGKTMVTALSEMSQDLRRLSSSLSGEVSNEAPTILERINTITSNLEKISDDIAQGKGSLGALIVDPSVYENLVDITGGAKKSFILRQAVKKSLSH